MTRLSLSVIQNNKLVAFLEIRGRSGLTEIDDFPVEVEQILKKARDFGGETGYCNVILKNFADKVLDEEVMIL